MWVQLSHVDSCKPTTATCTDGRHQLCCLCCHRFALSKMQMLRTMFVQERILMTRNGFIYVFRSFQVRSWPDNEPLKGQFGLSDIGACYVWL